ncbi:hypothetical protein SDC9_211773 [bioreactor metagenome]|uniref:Uncharacterized protein n=1 Tax=bioreactor metagenome TaxID=1076179 RepID=A0A645JWG6_9ZZZZ
MYLPAQRYLILDELAGFFKDVREGGRFFAGFDHADKARAEDAERRHRTGERASALHRFPQPRIDRLEVFIARLFLQQPQHFGHGEPAAHEG